MRKHRRTLRLALSLALTIAAFALLIRRGIDLERVWAELATVRLEWVAATLLSLTVYTFAKAIRWRVILRQSGVPIPLRESLVVLMIGQTLNTFIPLRIGDVARIYLIGRRGVRHGVVLGTLIVEKGLDLLCYAALFLGLAWLIPLPRWAAAALPSLLIIAVLLVGGWLWLWGGGGKALAYPQGGWLTRVVPLLNTLLQGVSALRDGRAGMQLLGWSILVWTTASLNNLLLMRAFGFDLPWISAVVVLLILQVGISLPSAPATLGVFEYLVVVALALFGIEESAALSYGILLHVIVLIPTFIGSVLFWERSLSIAHFTRTTVERVPSPPEPAP